MLKPSYLFRNARAPEYLELFLVSAISSLLLTRFFLAVTDYPTIGGGSLHIAHVLWGGVLMAAGHVLVMAFLGHRVIKLASIVSGIGFGLFIDELGKFITRDNNYFFQPTIAILYLLFIGLFFLFRSLGRTDRLDKRENLLNAVQMTEEVVIEDLDAPERHRVLRYLKHSDQSHPLVGALTGVLEKLPVGHESGQPLLRRWYRWLEKTYHRVIRTPAATTAIDAIFVAKVVFVLVSVGLTVVDALERDFPPNFNILLLQLVSSWVAAWYVFRGVFALRISRLRAYELFFRSLLIDIFVTQFFSFYRNQFDALPGFILNILLYIALRFLLHQERRVEGRKQHAQAAATV